ncbi:Na-translocating system protein MpsC family protein [Bacillus sp. 31A1R]|uniref:Na-translocating system protein MpsC family protein n=1 Tax=Robertmurraya mangrovi TaxID=3098077 RepID=A0ABU5J2U0_9BACI|nr:Na-translocating system protein MpsC family protein [Bacillus sp. 31A1R]MDZ5473680.1 Na-translocating system protein MpsC family protein [Bacillus sp. 31A1R]
MNNRYSSYHEDLLLLSSTLSKMLKRSFGKGPETCFVTLHSNQLTVYLRNYITPAEEVLLEAGQSSLALDFRSKVMESVFLEFAKEAIDALGINLDHFYSDWDYDKNTGILLLEEESTIRELESKSDSLLKERLFERISQVSTQVHKMPNQLELVRINQNLILIECQGFMLQIEKLLFEKGHLDILQERSKEIKDLYLSNQSLFENILGRNVIGLFMLWDYHKDRFFIYFDLQ